MKQTPQDKKSGCVVIVIAILVFGFIYDKLGCNTESNNKNETQTETAKNVVPSMTDEGYLKYFQEKWDAVKLEKEGKFPQYDHYQTSLNNILQEMLTVLE